MSLGVVTVFKSPHNTRGPMMRRAIYNRIVLILSVTLSATLPVSAQTVREKLNQTTDYQLRATAPFEQLLEVARHFKIPVGIEWLDQPAENVPQLDFKKGTVLELIRSIVSRAPEQQLVVEERLVRVFAPSAFHNKMNFLNLRLKRYCVVDECVLGANFEVRLGIDYMLYPEEFKHGFAGGYGGGEELLWIKGINICLKNATLRDIFNEIAAQSGQARWAATISPGELKGKSPFWIGIPLNEYGTSPITGHWWFFELREYRTYAGRRTRQDSTSNTQAQRK